MAVGQVMETCRPPVPEVVLMTGVSTWATVTSREATEELIMPVSSAIALIVCVDDTMNGAE